MVSVDISKQVVATELYGNYRWHFILETLYTIHNEVEVFNVYINHNPGN